MRPADVEEMRGLTLFSGVKESHLNPVLQSSFLQRFPGHVELVREGEPADFLHVVIDGQVEIFSAYRNRETTISVVGPDASFIVAAVLLDRIYLKSARTLVASRILMIPAESVRRLFSDDAAFARAITAELALAYRNVVKELKNQKLRSGLERLACWLLNRNSETGSAGRFEMPFDKKILASRLGMAPEVLSRAFSTLGAYGVEVNGPRISLADPAALEVLAKPIPTLDDPKL